MLTLWTLKNSWTYYHGITLGLCLTFSPQFTRQIIQKYNSFLYTISTINKELPWEMKTAWASISKKFNGQFCWKKTHKKLMITSLNFNSMQALIEIVNQKKITKDKKSHNHNIKFSLHEMSNRNMRLLGHLNAMTFTLAHIHYNLQ